MGQLTLRGIPDDIRALAEAEARSKGISLNKAFLAILRKGAARPARPRHQDRGEGEFTPFLGLWSEEEADAFDQALREQRGTDGELWP
ncbi:MAG: antitoxin [Thermodesulfobacteriota bacterium]